MSFRDTVVRLSLDNITVNILNWQMGEYEQPVYDNTPVELLPCGTIAIGGLFIAGDKLRWTINVEKADLLMADRIVAIGQRCRQLADIRGNPSARLIDYGWRFQERVNGGPGTRALAPGTIEVSEGNWRYYYAQYDVFVYDVRVKRNGGYWAVMFQAIELQKVNR